MANVNDVVVDGEKSRDIRSLLAGEDRDFLIRNNGDQVLLSSLNAKTCALYFSASWCGPCRNFTPVLVDLYNELSARDEGFEIIFVSGDEDEESFKMYFSKMPWLAIPFSDSKARELLNKLFKVMGIPHLLILSSNGDILNEDGVDAVRSFGVDGYPFTDERIDKLKEEEEAAKKEQNLRSLLVSPSRDYLISNTGAKVSVSDLEGKIVFLYFSVAAYRPCAEFTSLLQKIYEKIKEHEENFEIVLVSLDDDESSFKESFAGMPWLAIPFKDKICEKLPRYFELSTIPFIVILGVDGKTLNVDFSELVDEHGLDAWEAFPFSQEKMDLLAEKAKAKLDAQTLESLLISGELDYVINIEGSKVLVSELVGKNILLYFSAQWCGPCRAFLPKLIEEYHKIKNKDNAFEVIFLSSDRDQSSFDEFYSGMPWLALPFGDERKKQLSNIFKIRGIPSLVAIDSKGRTVTTNARSLLMTHGADAYPFNEERIKELEHKIEETAKAWPEKIKHKLHEEHELVLTRCASYGCNGCNEIGNTWSYRCVECNFDLHPKCALGEKIESEKDNNELEKTEGEGYVCDGEVCRKI